MNLSSFAVFKCRFFTGPLYAARFSYISGVAGLLAKAQGKNSEMVVTHTYAIGVTFHVLGKTKAHL